MIKKLLSFIVAAALMLSIVPAAALASDAGAKVPAASAEGFKAPVFESKGIALVEWDFETEPTAAGWTLIDEDGDGNNWNWVTESTPHSGTHHIMSASYSGGALHPDNWAISPEVEIPEAGAEVRLFVKNYSSSYPENFTVYVIDSEGAETAVSDLDHAAGTAWEEKVYDISAFAGQTVSIAIRHHESVDLWRFFIDDVSVCEPTDPTVIYEADVSGFPVRLNDEMTAGDIIAELAVPTGVNYAIDTSVVYDAESMDELAESDALEAGKTYIFGASIVPAEGYTFHEEAALTANGGALELDADFSGVENATKAWIVPVEMECTVAPLVGYYFEAQSELAGWYVFDNDGDNRNWGWYNGANVAQYAFEGQGFIGSQSYASYSNVTPDNYIMTPAAELPENATVTLSFYAAGLGADYAEHFAAYVTTNSDITAIDDMIELIPETEVTAEYVNYTADLSEYAGQTVYVVLRHFNCTGQNVLRVDQLEIFVEEDEEPGNNIITEADAIEMELPAYGENPDFDISVPEGAHYSVNMIRWTRYDGANDVELTAEDVYDDANSTYYAIIVLDPEEGWTFDENCVAMINGSEDDVDFSFVYEGSLCIASIDYEIEEPAAEPIVIENIEILNFVEPAWGEHPSYDVTVPEGANYYIEYTDWNWWSDALEDGDILDPSQTFNNENYVYYMYFEIVPAEGYTFTSATTITINGDDSIAETHGWSANGGYYWAYTVDFTVEEPAAGTLGDVDLDGDVDTVDALLALRYVMGLIDLTDEQLAQAEVNGDGEVSIMDALLVHRMAMNLIDSFPAEGN